jgi:hypothetical protein
MTGNQFALRNPVAEAAAEQLLRELADQGLTIKIVPLRRRGMK